MQRRRHLFSTATYLRHNANYVDLAPIHGYISGPSTVICLHYKSYRPSPVDLGRAHLLSVGQAHMTFEWAEHGR